MANKFFEKKLSEFSVKISKMFGIRHHTTSEALEKFAEEAEKKYDPKRVRDNIFRRLDDYVEDPLNIVHDLDRKLYVSDLEDPDNPSEDIEDLL